MANEEYLKVLPKGVQVWPKWRADNKRVTPDSLRFKYLLAVKYIQLTKRKATLRANYFCP